MNSFIFADMITFKPSCGQWLWILCIAAIFSQEGSGQVDILTLAEAERIIEALPEFGVSKSRGECPGFLLLAPPTAIEFQIQLRGECGTSELAGGSTTIANYRVNRTSGRLTTWGDGGRRTGPPVTSLKATAISAKIAAAARARRLSDDEASCVGLQSIALPPGQNRDQMKVLRVGPVSDGVYALSVGLSLTDPFKVMLTWDRYVDVAGAYVMGGPDEIPLAIEGEVLLNKIKRSRFTPTLSAFEAIQVALHLPQIAKRIKPGCSHLSAETGTSEQRYIALIDECGGPSEGIVIAAVEILTGSVTDPRNGKKIDNASSLAAAKRLISLGIAERAKEQIEINQTCHLKQEPPKR